MLTDILLLLALILLNGVQQLRYGARTL